MARSRVTRSSGVSSAFTPYGNPLRAKRLGVQGTLGQGVPFVTAKQLEYLHGNIMQIAEQIEDLWDDVIPGTSGEETTS